MSWLARGSPRLPAILLLGLLFFTAQATKPADVVPLEFIISLKEGVQATPAQVARLTAGTDRKSVV